MRSKEGEWVSWTIDGRAGAKLCLGPVFLGEISYPHDLGIGVCWKAWLNHEHVGFFRGELEAKQRIEREILKRFTLMQPAWDRFQAYTQQNSSYPDRSALVPALPRLTSDAICKSWLRYLRNFRISGASLARGRLHLYGGAPRREHVRLL